jgi:hypothetical protein
MNDKIIKDNLALIYGGNLWLQENEKTILVFSLNFIN